jgi:hypothetical protein
LRFTQAGLLAGLLGAHQQGLCDSRPRPATGNLKQSGIQMRRMVRLVAVVGLGAKPPFLQILQELLRRLRKEVVEQSFER